MDPNIYNAGPQGNPYDFIMNPQQPVRRNPLGNGFILKLVLILGVGGMIGLGLYIFAVMNGTNTNSNQVWLNIAQEQYELKRVATSGSTSIRAQNVKNFGANTSMTMTSDQYEVLTFLAKRGYKVQNKQLMLKFSPVTDQKLNNARNASVFDAAYVAELVNELKTYQGSLQEAYGKSGVKSEKALLKSLYDEAGLLIQQSTLKL